MKIAIIGSGIAGLTAAHLLHRRHDITIFEASGHVGGHARTRTQAMNGDTFAVDTGFVVFNHETYPNFSLLLSRLGVQSQPSEMSFGVRCERTGIEYCGSSLNRLFAQRSNLLRPAFHGMLREILRFNREARRRLPELEGCTLGEMLACGGYSGFFQEHYILPMGSAIWSCSPRDLLDFPAAFFVRFFDNHRLLGATGHLRWRTVRGGSARYVEAMTRPFRDRIRLRRPVRSIRRRPDGVLVAARDGEPQGFDHVVLATHADQSLRMLADPSEAERKILGAFPYRANKATLHTDTSILPRQIRARASWNYRVAGGGAAGPVQVTYDMSRLQSLASPSPFLVSLNQEEVDESCIRERVGFEHPLYLPASGAAQKRHAEISGHRRTHYCGAYWGNGFHEDGIVSAMAVGRYFDEATL